MRNKAVTTSEIGPFLKWAGGKGRLLPQFQRFFPENMHDMGYVEPFMGSGAVFFHILQTRKPRQSTLLDANPELVNLFTQIRDHLGRLIPLLVEHRNQHNNPEISEDQRRQYYNEVRAWNPTAGTSEAAARFLYLNKTCFNGLHRLNSKGQFNVPMGRYKNPALFDPNHLEQVSALLQGVRIETCSYRNCSQYIQDGDFVYLDPPYEPLSRTSSFTAYAKDDFTQEDQLALCKMLDGLGRRVKWMLSNSTAPLIEELYEKPMMYKNYVMASRSINSVGGGRGRIRELVITNYEAHHLAQLPLIPSIPAC